MASLLMQLYFGSGGFADVFDLFKQKNRSVLQKCNLERCNRVKFPAFLTHGRALDRAHDKPTAGAFRSTMCLSALVGLFEAPQYQL
jgi:hypothetical protein